VAGTDTAAAASSCITYYLTRTPKVLKNLQEEIRGSFKSLAEITGASTANLPYLNAIIQEGYRIFPPLPLGLPRIVPEGGESVDGYYVAAGVSIICEARRLVSAH
jgi:cytochrome P450